MSGARVAPSALSLTAVLLGLLLTVAGCGDRWAARHGLTLVDTQVQYPRWSKDGGALFYIQVRRARTRLWRYDVRSRKKHCYDMPGGSEYYDISPNGKSVVYLDGRAVKTLCLETGRVKTIHTSRKTVWGLYWLPGSVGIVLQPEGSGIRALGPDGSVIREMRGRHSGLVYAAYGSGTVCITDDRRYRYCNLRTGDGRYLQMRGIRPQGTTTHFYYLSDRCLVYRAPYDPAGEVSILDLRTGTSEVAKMADFDDWRGQPKIGISPDMSMYWMDSRPRGEWSVSKLYIGKFPQHVRRQFARPFCPGDR